VDGLKGFPSAIESVFPKAQVQLCIVHMIRAGLNYVTWKDRKQVVADLKPIYKAATERRISTPIYCGLLNQRNKQKLPGATIT
jgi:transposase-like protein